jgi:putative transposase
MPSSLKRYQTEGHYHFLTFSCYHRMPKLNDDRARIVFEEMLEAIRRRHRFFVFGYVLMPEHVHLLVTEPTVYPLATSISVLKGEIAKVLRQLPHPCAKKPRMNGAPTVPFWQARY